ncbi:hypothetical protein [Lysobacter humi (ex Lee et al. 2017)]
MCNVDWSALGTWVTGIAAALIALFAFQYSRRLGTVQDRAASRRARAYALATVEEFKSMRSRATMCLEMLRDVLLSASDAPNPSAFAGMFSALPSFAPSDWLSESPAIGDLQDEAIPAVARAIAAGSEAERFRKMIERVLKDVGPEHFEPGARPMLTSCAKALEVLVLRIDDAVPLLEQTAAPHGR